MPSSPWVSFQIRTPAPITALGAVVSEGLSSVKTQLELVQVKTSIAAALATNPADPTATGLNLAVQAVLRAAESAVGSLIDDTGAYLLVVPLPKKGFVQLLPDSASDAPGSTFFTLPLPNVIEQLSPEDRARLRESSVYEQLTDTSQVYRGGNAYFVRTLAESMFDPGDSSRPKFANTDYWAYAVFVGGAADVASAIPLASYVERLIGNIAKLGATRGTVSVVPQNLRATPSGRERMAVVEWDPLSPSRVLVSFDDAVVRPVEYAVVRAKDFRVTTCTNAADLFGTGELTLNQTGRFGAKVVDISRYDGISARWVDRSPLENDTDYYYMVGFRCRVGSINNSDGGSDPILTPYDKLAAAGPVRIRTGAVPVTRGQMPDWTRVPSFATIFPPVERFLDSCLERIRSIARSSQTLSDINQHYVEALQAEVERYGRLADEFASAIAAVTKLLTMPRSVSGMGMKTGTGRGPASTFLAQVINDFADLSDVDRPAFDQGDEYVTGFVILAVGPDPEAVANQLAIFKLLFGSPDENELLSGVNSIGEQIAVLEREVIEEEAAASFNDDMSPRPVGSGDASCDSSVTEDEPTFDSSMTPNTEI